jgi:hypothetical protein
MATVDLCDRACLALEVEYLQHGGQQSFNAVCRSDIGCAERRELHVQTCSKNCKCARAEREAAAERCTYNIFVVHLCEIARYEVRRRWYRAGAATS